MGYFGPDFGMARNSLRAKVGGAAINISFRTIRMIATAIESTDPSFVASSDLRTQAAVAGALASSQYAALRRLDCRVTDGVVEISGIVSSYYLKQLAQAAVLQLHQARSVRNLVEVEGEASILVATHCGANRPSGA
jgi:hypothetical protein